MAAAAASGGGGVRIATVINAVYDSAHVMLSVIEDEHERAEAARALGAALSAYGAGAKKRRASGALPHSSRPTKASATSAAAAAAAVVVDTESESESSESESSDSDWEDEHWPTEDDLPPFVPRKWSSDTTPLMMPRSPHHLNQKSAQALREVRALRASIRGKKGDEARYLVALSELKVEEYQAATRASSACGAWVYCAIMKKAYKKWGRDLVPDWEALERVTKVARTATDRAYRRYIDCGWLYTLSTDDGSVGSSDRTPAAPPEDEEEEGGGGAAAAADWSPSFLGINSLTVERNLSDAKQANAECNAIRYVTNQCRSIAASLRVHDENDGKACVIACYQMVAVKAESSSCKHDDPVSLVSMKDDFDPFDLDNVFQTIGLVLGDPDYASKMNGYGNRGIGFDSITTGVWHAQHEHLRRVLERYGDELNTRAAVEAARAREEEDTEAKAEEERVQKEKVTALAARIVKGLKKGNLSL